MPDTVRMPLPRRWSDPSRTGAERKVRAELLATQGDDVTPQRKELSTSLPRRPKPSGRAPSPQQMSGDGAQAAAKELRALDRLGLDRIAKDADTLEGDHHRTAGAVAWYVKLTTRELTTHTRLLGGTFRAVVYSDAVGAPGSIMQSSDAGEAGALRRALRQPCAAGASEKELSIVRRARCRARRRERH